MDQKYIPFIIHEAPMSVGETKVIESTDNRPIAQGILQDADVVNRNRRCYAKADLDAQIKCERTRELLKSGNFKGENGHPMSENLVRQSELRSQKNERNNRIFR